MFYKLNLFQPLFFLTCILATFLLECCYLPRICSSNLHPEIKTHRLVMNHVFLQLLCVKEKAGEGKSCFFSQRVVVHLFHFICCVQLWSTYLLCFAISFLLCYFLCFREDLKEKEEFIALQSEKLYITKLVSIYCSYINLLSCFILIYEC